MNAFRNEAKILQVILLLSMAALILLISLPVGAQVSGATLSGTVSDSSGAVIPRAQIAIENTATGVTAKVRSNTSGFYSVPDLIPGPYAVTVTAPGFTTLVRNGIVLTVGAQQVLNLTIAVGETTQRVVVTAAAPTIETSSSTLSEQVNGIAIRQLPLNGRDWSSLASLEPGVTDLTSIQLPDPSGFTRVNAGMGNRVSIAGTRPEQNNYVMDGVYYTDSTNGGPGNATGASMGVDGIAEFTILTNSYSAQYGLASGGVFNVVTRSGTNQFHGCAFDFLRNSALDARNYFDPPTIPPFRRNQYGGCLGGPIQKDKMFFFGDYEGLSQILGTTEVDVVPSANYRAGIVENATGTGTTTVPISPDVVPFLGYWPLPNDGLIAPGNVGNYLIESNTTTSDEYALGRIDRQFSAKDSVYASYQMDDSHILADGAFDTTASPAFTFSQFVASGWDHILSANTVNSLRAGLHRENTCGGCESYVLPLGNNPLYTSYEYGIEPGTTAPSLVVGSGITSAGGGATPYGAGASFKYTSLQAFDDLFWVKGTNSLKVGAMVEQIQDNDLEDPQSNGMITFTSWTNFLENTASQIEANYEVNGAQVLTHFSFRATVLGAYIQDDIRWRPNLTFNLGMRYEMTTIPEEANGKMTSLTPSLTNATPTTGKYLFTTNPTLRNFQPRIGFAWDPFNNGKNSVRGGVALFDVLPLMDEWEQVGETAAPFAEIGISADPVSPAIVPDSGSYDGGTAASINQTKDFRRMDLDRDPRNNYGFQWNLTLQRQLLRSTALTVSYVGSRFVHNVFHVDDINYVLPSMHTAEGWLWPLKANGQVGGGTKLDPAINRLDLVNWTASSNYNGLTAEVTKTMSRGFSVHGSYTWSKSLDDGSATTRSQELANSMNNMWYFDPKTRYGPSDFMRAQVLSSNYQWNLPKPGSLKGPIGWALSGWETNGILSALTGPVDLVSIAGDPIGTGSSVPWEVPNVSRTGACKNPINKGNPTNYWNASCFSLPVATPDLASLCTPFGGTSAPIAGTCANLNGNEGRNSLTGPGQLMLSPGLFKNNYIRRFSENFDVQWRMEFFNVINHANFLPPANTGLDGDEAFTTAGVANNTVGKISGTATTSRQIEFALKITW